MILLTGITPDTAAIVVLLIIGTILFATLLAGAISVHEIENEKPTISDMDFNAPVEVDELNIY